MGSASSSLTIGQGSTVTLRNAKLNVTQPNSTTSQSTFIDLVLSLSSNASYTVNDPAAENPVINCTTAAVSTLYPGITAGVTFTLMLHPKSPNNYNILSGSLIVASVNIINDTWIAPGGTKYQYVKWYTPITSIITVSSPIIGGNSPVTMSSNSLYPSYYNLTAYIDNTTNGVRFDPTTPSFGHCQRYAITIGSATATKGDLVPSSDGNNTISFGASGGDNLIGIFGTMKTDLKLSYHYNDAVGKSGLTNAGVTIDGFSNGSWYYSVMVDRSPFVAAECSDRNLTCPLNIENLPIKWYPPYNN